MTVAVQKRRKWHLATRPMTIQAMLLGVQRTYRHRAESVDPDPSQPFAAELRCNAARAARSYSNFSSPQIQGAYTCGSSSWPMSGNLPPSSSAALCWYSIAILRSSRGSACVCAKRAWRQHIRASSISSLWVGIAHPASDSVQRAPEAAVRYVSGPEQQFFYG